MSTITARYVDTCLSDYLQDSYSRPGQALCLSSLGCTLDETVDALYESIDFDSGLPESVYDLDIKDAFRLALQGVDLHYIDEDGNRQDEPDDERDGDEPYIYVVLEWDATVIKMRVTIDIDYLANGTDPYDINKALLETVNHIAGSGAFSHEHLTAELENWGATAEEVKGE